MSAPEPDGTRREAPTFVGARDWPRAQAEMRWPPPPGGAAPPEEPPPGAPEPTPAGSVLVLLALGVVLMQVASDLVPRAWLEQQGRGDALRAGDAIAAWEALLAQPGGAWMIVLPNQVVLLGLALLLGRAGAPSLRAGLWLGRGRTRLWPTLGCVALTLALQYALDAALRALFPDPPVQARVGGLVVEHAGFATALVVLALLPALCEELFFRGWALQRLARAWRPWIAIAVSGAIFAFAHGGLYGLCVLPLALWFGFVAWRSDSIWPSIACHAANNAFALVLIAREGASSAR